MQILPNYNDVLRLDPEFEGVCRTFVDPHRNGRNEKGDMHYHDCAEFGICYSGNGVFFIGEQVQPFYGNYVVYIPPGVPHIATSPDASPSSWVFLYADPAALNDPAVPTQSAVFRDEDAFALLNMAIRAQSSPADGGQYYRSLIAAFFCRLGIHQTEKSHHDSYAYRQILPAVHFIVNRYEETPPVEALAGHCNMSVSLFYRSFREAMGMSPIEYLHSVRISMAETLLCSDRNSITEIAHQTGYPSVSSFYRQFVKKHGISPPRIPPPIQGVIFLLPKRPFAESKRSLL